MNDNNKKNDTSVIIYKTDTDIESKLMITGKKTEDKLGIWD